jgi:hypothetical protein
LLLLSAYSQAEIVKIVDFDQYEVDTWPLDVESWKYAMCPQLKANGDNFDSARIAIDPAPGLNGHVYRANAWCNAENLNGNAKSYCKTWLRTEGDGNGKCRHEMVFSEKNNPAVWWMYQQFGERNLTAFQIYIDSDDPDANFASWSHNAKRTFLFQDMAFRVSGDNTPEGSLFLYGDNGNVVLQYQIDYSTSTTGENLTSIRKNWTIQPDQWHTIVIDKTRDFGNGGQFTIYIDCPDETCTRDKVRPSDDAAKTVISNAPNAIGNKQIAYKKWGLYRGSEDVNIKHVVYYKNLYVGDGSESFDSIMTALTGSIPGSSGVVNPIRSNNLPVVIVKADDYRDVNWSTERQRWEWFDDLLYTQNNINFSFGAIGEHFDGNHSANFITDAQALLDKGHEVWNHGFDGTIGSASPYRNSYSDQLNDITTTQNNIHSQLGVYPVSLGTPGNQKNSNTADVVNDFDPIRIWMRADKDATLNSDILPLYGYFSSGALGDMDPDSDGLDCSNSPVSEISDRYQTIINSDRAYWLWQLHPRNYGSSSNRTCFENRFNRFLSDYPNVTFMTAKDYYIYSGGILPADEQTVPNPPTLLPVD